MINHTPQPCKAQDLSHDHTKHQAAMSQTSEGGRNQQPTRPPHREPPHHTDNSQGGAMNSLDAEGMCRNFESVKTYTGMLRKKRVSGSRTCWFRSQRGVGGILKKIWSVSCCCICWCGMEHTFERLAILIFGIFTFLCMIFSSLICLNPVSIFTDDWSSSCTKEYVFAVTP